MMLSFCLIRKHVLLRFHTVLKAWAFDSISPSVPLRYYDHNVEGQSSITISQEYFY